MSRSTPRWLPVLLFAAVAGVYLPSARYGFLYDDFEIILMQEPARSVGDVARIFAEPHGLPLSQMPHYRAPTRATLLVQKALHGDRAGPFHVFNALLMGCVALAAFAVLRHARFGIPAVAAALGAAAFALHPVASSTVYPISSGRETLLPGLFALLAVAAWLRGGISGRVAGGACFALALLGKESGLVVPALFAAADALHLTPDPPERSASRWAARYVPLLALIAAYLVLRSVVFAGTPAEEDIDPLPFVLGHLAAHPLGPVHSLLYFVQTFFAPYLHTRYEPPLAVWLSLPRLALGLAALALLVLAALRLPRSDRAPLVFWLLWVPLAMGMTLNLLPQEASFAERFVLLSLLGPIALIATVAARAAAGGRQRTAIALGLAMVAVLSAATLQRGRDYRDDLAFTRQWVRSNPASGNAHHSLGSALARHGHSAEAMAELRAAVQLEPALAAAHYNLAVLLTDQGRVDEAIAELREVLRWDPSDDAARSALAQLSDVTRRARDAPALGTQRR